MGTIIVTGGAGFIGSCLIAHLNALGHRDIVVVDHWDDQGEKRRNLAGKAYTHYYDKVEFLELVLEGKAPVGVSHIIHLGACSSTTGQDRAYYLRNNYEYSCHLAAWSVEKRIRFIYASSAATYGDGENGYSDSWESIRLCKPLNYYGESKQLFDMWVIEKGFYNKVVGLKFFNVFGPNEYHKGDMKSVIAKAYERVVQEGKMLLFQSHRPGIADGEQKRDFVYVKDVVEVIRFLMDNAGVNGIYNVGTGEARTWNDVARALFSAAGRTPSIEYTPMPEVLRSRYQYFTQADMTRLLQAGYTRPFSSLEAAVKDYAGYLKSGTYL